MMSYLSISICIVFMLSSCFKKFHTGNDFYYYHYVQVDSILNNERTPYKVLSSHVSNKKCADTMYASSFLCVKANTSDSVIVIVPCESYELRTGVYAKTYGNVPKTGQPILVAFDKNQAGLFLRLKKVYGSLKIPEQ